MKVKVCGIMNYEDAAMALDLGADVLGFNFYPESPRYLDPEVAGSIIRRLPVFVVKVGLFVNVPDPRTVVDEAKSSRVQVLQLHGDENADYIDQLQGWPLIKAIRIRGDDVPTEDFNLPADAYLLDYRDDSLFGGTGKAFDWEIVARLPRKKPLILAGGLNAGNVQRAIEIVRPFAVDVCSGVESSPGKKDRGKLKEFIEEVRNAIEDQTD